MKLFLRLIAIVSVIGLFSVLGEAQSSSGTISGHVVDATGGVVVNAEVQLINRETGVTVSTKVLPSGDFIFPDVQPGTFAVVVKMTGYKELHKDGLRLSASERLSAGTIVLEIGAVTESVEVAAANTAVQTSSAEVSGVIDTKQMDNLLQVSRDFMGMLKTIPGVVGGGGTGSLGTSGTPNINGGRNVMNSGNVDGVSGGPRGGDNFDTPPNLDAIQEVKVLTSNYQAEYGAGASGPVINVITKGGGREFHGGVYYYGRNEAFNANDWFNKYNGVARPRYRYNTIGGTIGGPIYWPGKFNPNRDKLFFFYSQEYWPTQKPDGLKTYMVPTALERTGDFSQTPVQGTSGATLINIKMPGQPTSACVSTGSSGNHAGCYAGNKLPSNVINAETQALLTTMPLPNFTNLAVSKGNYNYITNNTADDPVYQEIFRIDYAPTEKMHMFYRQMFFTVNSDSYASAANKLPWLMKVNYQTPRNPTIVYDMTYAFSSTLLNEFIFGTSMFAENQLYENDQLAKAQKSASGYNIGQIYPSNNPLNLLPAVSFGGITNVATYGWDSRFPMYDRAQQFSASDSISKILGTHSLKFGVDFRTGHYLQAHSSSGIPEGNFAYDTNSSNPNDSYNAFANTLQGLFYTYAEPTARTDYNPRTYVYEGYAQDQWRITPKLTLDYGSRFAYAAPPTLQVGANFVPSLFQRGVSPTLYQYAKVNGTTVAVDPSGNTYPAAYAGLFVPNTGSLTNGAITTKSHDGYPEGLIYGTGFQVAPRLGFAYDVFGDGKTAVRGGVGIFINPATQIGQEGDMTHNPPNEFVPTQYYGNVNSFLTAGSLIGPPSFGASFALHPKESRVYGFSLGVQQDVGFGTVVGVGYVGNIANHLTGQSNINEVPYGAEYQLANQNPTASTQCKAGQIINVNCTPSPLPDNFFRPYQGYGTITYRQTNLNSNYHSLQVTANRRFKAGLQFGLAYTWSRAMDYTDSYDGSVATYQNLRVWNYGPAGFDRRNNLVVNYLWSIPNGSKLWNNLASRALLDGWQISGIAYHVSGAPTTVSFSTTDSVNLTGGGDGARIAMTGDAMKTAPHKWGEWFDTSVFQRPTQSTLSTTTGQLTLSNGVSPYAPVVGPGYTDFDTALFKNFMVEKKFAVQLRLEAYNTLNSPEFNAVNTTAKFSTVATGATQTNTQFGQLSGDNGARVLQLAGRINF